MHANRCRSADAGMFIAVAATFGFGPLVAPDATAEVVRIDVRQRVTFAGGQTFGEHGAYEKIVGRLELAVDPNAPSNAVVVDLARAPRDSGGKVRFSTDFFLLTPANPKRGNRRLLYEVNNRGNKLMLGAFNNRGGNDPTSALDAGNGFLMRQGYSLLWCGWNGDVSAGNNKLLINLPIATDDGNAITGPIHAEICVDAKSFSQPLYWGGSDPYPAVTLDQAAARLTHRLTRREAETEIPRERWQFARVENGRIIPDAKYLFLADGFEPGRLYDLVYVGKNPRVTGLGLAAVRDVISFFRYERADAIGTWNPLAEAGAGPAIERAFGFGISQSGRFLHHFVFEGFNADERGRIVFDGVFAHVGGGGKGFFNARFCQTTRHGSPHEDLLYPSDVFPFTSTPTTDAVTGERGDMLQRARKSGRVPKIFFTNTSTEYWCRAASLLHTTPDGTTDVPLDPHVRIYFVAGGQHGVSTSSDAGIYQNPRNILDYRPVLRALLVALDKWASGAGDPPESAYPRLSNGTLVGEARFRELFPKMARVNLPRAAYAPFRLDFGPRWKTEHVIDLAPARAGLPFRTLVPAVGPDGNELAGIHLPEIDVPTATFTGWNVRGRQAGAEGELARLTGSYLPFPQTKADRERTGDPRPAVLERYPTRDEYVARVRHSAAELEKAGYLLEEDGAVIVEQSTRHNAWPK